MVVLLNIFELISDRVWNEGVVFGGGSSVLDCVAGACLMSELKMILTKNLGTQILLGNIALISLRVLISFKTNTYFKEPIMQRVIGYNTREL